MRRFALLPAGSYAAAALLGAWFTWLVMPGDMILGTGPFWNAPFDDLAQNLTGHLAFQQDVWRWPPLIARNLLWPDGVSIALTDSNPLFSLVAKVLAGLVGHPVNLFGVWFALCWLLQPVAAVYVVRSLEASSLMAAVAASVIALSFPALLYRYPHINLCGHFLMLMGLGWSIRMVADQGARWWQAALLATVTIFIHPFLFVILCALYAPPVIASVLMRRGVAAALLGFVVSTALPYGLFAWLASVSGGGEFGYGTYSMNLGAPFWPQRSGVFGAELPILDATEGQYEGFNYLGAGALFLLAVAVVAVVSGRFTLPNWRLWIGHGLVLLVLTALAVSHKVYLGPWAVFAIEAHIIEKALAPVRAGGRLFWPVGYLLALVPLVIVARRLRPTLAVAVLGVAALLQWLDAGPLRGDVQAFFGASRPALNDVALPQGALLVTAATHCGPPGEAGTIAGRLRLDVIRAGMALGEMRLSRYPGNWSCEQGTSDALELALRPGEVRAFIGARGMSSLRSELLGQETRCRQGQSMTLCSHDAATGWETARIGAAVVPLPPGTVVEGADLGPFLGWGWVPDRELRYWSSGPRAVLLFRMPELPAAARLRVRLQLEGIGKRAGQPIKIRTAAWPNHWPFTGPGWTESLVPDAELATLDLDVAPVSEPGGIVRLVIEIPEPVDPRVRGKAMPVRWAGVRLHRVSALPTELAKAK